MHLLCPHCKNPIELVRLDPAAEITCTACGSSFHLDQGSTTGWAEAAGSTVGRFTVLETVGHGAFGTVFKARDPELDRTVAVKVPRRGNVGSGPAEVDRFLREARSVAQLRHPAIVAVHEVGVNDGGPYLVSDFVEGVTLADLLTARRPAPREAARLIAEVADALEHAHRQGVVHRDVKPSNIMVRPDGSPVVMDFGLAKRDAGEVTMTLDGQVLGTPAYMSPEQARGEGHRVDGRSDVYSLGVILYQLLTGELPFRGNTRMLLHQVLHDEPKPPRALNDKVPRDLETVALKAMAKEPARRYPTAGEFAADLRRFLGGEPVRARPVGRAERAWRWARRNPTVAALSTAVALLLVAATAGATAAAVRFRAQADRERELTADAQRSAADAAAAGERAAGSAAESRARLARRYVAAAERLIADGDLLGSLPWLVEALKLEQGDPDREHVHRVRLGCVLRACPRLLHAWPHAHQVAEIAFAPDPRYVLAQSRTAPGDVRGVPAGAEHVYVWDTETDRPCPVPRAGSELPLAAAFHPAGNRLAVLGSDRRLRLFDWPGGRLAAGPWDLPGALKSGQVVFSPDGRYLAAGVGSVQVFDLEAGQPVGTTVPGMATRFRPDGRTLVTGNGSVWEWETGRRVFRPPVSDASLGQADVSPDGRRLLVQASAPSGAGRRGRSGLRAYDLETGQPVGPTLARESWLTIDFTFGRGGRLAANGAEDADAWVWDVETGSPVCPPLKHRGPVDGVRFAPDGRFLLTASADQTARVWDVRTGLAAGPVLRHDQRLFRGAFSPDGRRVAVGGYQGGQVRVWEWAGGGELPVALPPPGPGEKRALSDAGDRLAVWRADTGVRVWEVTSGRPVGEPFDVGPGVTDFRFLPGGRGLWVVGPYPVDSPQGPVRQARVWDPATGRPLTPPVPEGPPERHPGGHLGPAGVLLLRQTTEPTGGHRLEVVDGATGRPVGPAFTHTEAVQHAVFSPDGARVVTLHGFSDFKWTEVWNVATGRPACPPLSHDYGVQAAAFRPDGLRLVTAGTDKMARVWDPATGRPVTPPMPHRFFTWAAAFGADGRFVATADLRNDSDLVAATAWDAATGELVLPPVPLPRGEATVALDAAGARLIVLDGAGAVRTWSLAPETRPVADLEDLAAALAQARFDGGGNLVRLPADTFPQAAARLRAAFPEYFRRSTDDAAWHDRQARDAEVAEEWFTADWHLSRLIDRDRTAAALWNRRGAARAGLGRWAAAVADYETAVGLGPAGPADWRRLGWAQGVVGRRPAAAASYARAIAAGSDSPWDWYFRALLLADAGDADGCRRTAADQRSRFAAGTDPDAVYCLAMTGTILPGPAADLGPVLVRMARVSERAPRNVRYLEGVGYLRLRAGDPTGAVKAMTDALRAAGDSPAADAWIWLVLAMAHDNLGQKAEAHSWLAKSKSWLNDPARASLNWGQVRHLQLLLAEAVKQLGPPPAEAKPAGTKG